MLSFENADAAIQDHLGFGIDLGKSQQRQNSGFKTKSGFFFTFMGLQDIMKEIYIVGHLVPPVQFLEPPNTKSVAAKSLKYGKGLETGNTTNSEEVILGPVKRKVLRNEEAKFLNTVSVSTREKQQNTLKPSMVALFTPLIQKWTWMFE